MKAQGKFLTAFPTSSMKKKSISDILKVNKLNARLPLFCLWVKWICDPFILFCNGNDCCEDIPSQQLLKSVLGDKMSDEKYVEGVSSIRETAKTNGIDKTMYQHGLDVIIGPMNGRILTIAVAA